MVTKSKVSRVDRLAAIREKLQNTDVGMGSAGFLSLKEGTTTIRILPEVGEMGFFFQTVGVHNFPPDGKKRVYCPAFTTEGEHECPICEVVQQLYKAGDAASKELASQMRVSKKYWMNVIDRGDEKAGPKMYTPGPTVFDAVISIINDPDYGDITDISEGWDLRIERKGTGRLDTSYETRPRAKSTPLGTQEQVDEWLEKAKDLSWVEVSEDPDEDGELSKGHAVFILPYDRIAKEFDLDAIGQEEDDEPEPRRPAAKNGKKVTHKVVEEEEPEVDDDDADEPPAKPVRMARKSTRR